jgi:phosphoglycerate dehydrogenase-like enzyme
MMKPAALTSLLMQTSSRSGFGLVRPMTTIGGRIWSPCHIKYSIPTRRFLTVQGGGNWNRETSKPLDFDIDAPIIQEARIISLTDPKDPANDPVNDAAKNPSELPNGASLLAIGSSLKDFDLEALQAQEPNVIFVSHPLAREPLAQLLDALPTVEWVHARSAGIDFLTSDALSSSPVLMTNARGQFSSTLAEYTLMACSYFAKDLPRLMKQKSNRDYNRYPVQEIRGATLGIVGYGDIGHACARLASSYGMKIIALRRNVAKAKDDPYCTQVYSNDKESLNRLFSECDYILCSAPLTPETKGMIGKEQFDSAKKDAVFINLGRGPVVDEDALIEALKTRKLKGAALDVFATEPLPKESELWDLEYLLLSP